MFVCVCPPSGCCFAIVRVFTIGVMRLDYLSLVLNGGWAGFQLNTRVRLLVAPASVVFLSLACTLVGQQCPTRIWILSWLGTFRAPFYMTWWLWRISLVVWGYFYRINDRDIWHGNTALMPNGCQVLIFLCKLKIHGCRVSFLYYLNY